VDFTKIARVAVADQRIVVWNPVTPHGLIYVPEQGEALRNAKGELNFATIMPESWQENSA